MKKKREMPLAEALDEISSTVRQLKEEGVARVNGYEARLDDTVMLEIEAEAEKGKAELEFEIKWPVKGKSRSKGKAAARKSGGRRRLLLALTGLALVAGVVALKRRGNRDAGEEEDEI